MVHVQISRTCRVKIPERDLQKALVFGCKQGCFINLWRSSGVKSSVAGVQNESSGKGDESLGVYKAQRSKRVVNVLELQGPFE